MLPNWAFNVILRHDLHLKGSVFGFPILYHLVNKKGYLGFLMYREIKNFCHWLAKREKEHNTYRIYRWLEGETIPIKMLILYKLYKGEKITPEMQEYLKYPFSRNLREVVKKQLNADDPMRFFVPNPPKLEDWCHQYNSKKRVRPFAEVKFVCRVGYQYYALVVRCRKKYATVRIVYPFKGEFVVPLKDVNCESLLEIVRGIQKYYNSGTFA